MNLILAVKDSSPWLAQGITAAVLPLVFAVLYRSAKSQAGVGVREVRYGLGMRRFVMFFWAIMAVAAIAFAWQYKGEDLRGPLGGMALFGGLILVLHLEIFFVRITWDDMQIRTQSPWRSSRVIPMEAVESCDYSAGLQWYRIHTRGHGTVRLHLMASGVPQLLAALPCPAPPYPPPGMPM